MKSSPQSVVVLAANSKYTKYALVCVKRVLPAHFWSLLWTLGEGA